MVEDQVGYRFSPTGEESINYYLKNKNLGKTWLVKDSINEINICSFEPMCLPSLSKIKSDDLIWYFFSPIEYANVKKKTMKRTTASGYWKATGKDRIIKDKRGSKIGIKKTLVYHEGKVANGVKTPWVMHEYHITYLPPNQTTYVLCQVKYKGEDGDISYGGSDSVVSHSDTIRAMNTVPEVQVEQPMPAQDCLSLDDLRIPLNVEEDHVPLDAFDPDTFFDDNNLNLPQQTPYSEDYWTELLGYNGGDYDAVIADQELIMQENRNVYRPRKALSGIIVDCSSDSDCDNDGDDAESISATSYQGPSSPHGSVGSSNKHFPRGSSTDSCKDLQTSGDLSVNKKSRENQRRRRTVSTKQEVKRGTSRAVDASIDQKTSMVKTEKKGWFILEETMERNHKPRYIYLMNMITCFILLMGLIGNIKF